MRFISIFSVFVSLFAIQANASTVKHFTCVTEKEFKDAKMVKASHIKISFALKDLESDAPSVIGEESGANGDESPGSWFKVAPYYEEIGSALMFADNYGAAKSAKGIDLSFDEIGMMHTDIFLYSDAGYRSGYVKTSGQSNEKVYSKLSCSIK